ncbi:RAD50-interacting protein 1 [Osmerus eperlanus]|uniref:RAD50-interacting protein 1 n=1 Tax=Osmerus eperlanus TaxID=29151 RepID=UPI002E13AE93
MAAPGEELSNGASDDQSSPVSTNDEDSKSGLGDGELPDYVIDFMEKEIGGDLKSLKKVKGVLEKLTAENKLLEEQVLTVSSSVPLRVSTALSAAEEARVSLDAVLQRERSLSNTLQQQLQLAQPLADSLSQALGRMDTVERYMRYLQVLRRIDELSDSIQQCVMTSSTWEAVGAVGRLASLDLQLQASGCFHLQAFTRDTLRFWHKILKDRLTSDFEEVLTQLQWPLLSPPSQTLAPPANAPEISSQLELLVSQLLALQTSDDLTTEKTPPTRPGSAPPLSPPPAQPLSQAAQPPSSQTPLLPSQAPPLSQEAPPLSLPIQIMLVPLMKRFRYHFTGNRQTNCLSKPEWYLTQVLTWVGNSSTFLEEKIQPILDRAAARVNAKVELCRGLLGLLQEKLSLDASRLLADDTLFCHLVDEMLQFEKELRGPLAYPPALPGVLGVLLEDSVLNKWLSVERKMAVEKVDTMLSADGAWSSQYRDISDMDDMTLTPDCAETFMTLLLVITERYRPLPCQQAQLRFLALQRELVDDFRIRLTQVMKEESRWALGPRYGAILNAVNYISTVLADWGDNLFFLQLQQAAVSLGEEGTLGGPGGALGPLELGRLASLEGSLFEGLEALLERLRADMLGRLLEAVLRDVKEHAQPYCRERWLSLPSQSDQATMSLSSSACPMMLCLRDHLLSLQGALCPPLFQSAWQGLAERLDHFLYQDVILYNHFNEGGAAQLQFDMTRNLFPLFGHYCKRPENFFKHVKEACIILCLGVGSALLLRDVLRQAAQQEEEEPEGAGLVDGQAASPVAALNELGVFRLAPGDVLILLGLRASWPGQ